MKKALAAILLLVYFTVSTGFVVSLHYCMDRLDSAQIGERKADKCGKCGMHKNKHKCCWDDVKVVKLQTSHVASKGMTADFTLPAVVLTADGFLLSPFYNFTQSNKAIAHGPPLSEQATYLHNCVFRI
jgi:hypothetical protein